MNTQKSEKQTHVFDKSILRQYDIRGTVGKSLKEDDCYFVGRSFGTVLVRSGLKSVVVGYDARESSKTYTDMLVKGLSDCGLKVCNIGLVPTPVVYYAMNEYKYDACAIVTGSHLAVKYNGIKMCLAKGSFNGDDIKALGPIAEAGDFAEGVGTVEEKDYSDAYVDRILKDYTGKKDLKIAWDNGNGAAGIILQKLVAKMPGKHIVLFDEFDSSFPNHHPDPSVEENMQHLIKAVKENNCDVGIAFDGDADRIGVVDEKGAIIWADLLMTVYAADVLAKNPGGYVISDVKASRVLFDEIERLGGKPVVWKTGAALMRPKLQEIGGLLGGELSGHVIFADKYYGFDDGVYCGIRIADILSNSSKTMSQLVEHLPKMISTPELRLEVDASRKFAIPEEIKERLLKSSDPTIKVNDIDGVRVTVPEGWWLVRSSNTEELLTLRIEAFNEEGLKKLEKQVVEQLHLSGFELSF